MGTSRVVPALLGLSAFAFYITWGASLSNGTLDRMLHIRGAAVPCIPGTHEPLRLRFTGIAPIDYWCTIMVLFFWEAVDGSHPATSMNGIYFLGQLVGIWTLVWVEGIRRGERHMVAKAALWALAMQNFTLACIGPIYFALHLEASHNVRAPAARQLRYLPWSMVLGYVVPSIMLGLPSPNVVSYPAQQAAIALWTPFPVWVGLIHSLLSWCGGHIYNISPEPAAERSSKIYLHAARPVYLFAVIGSAIVHIGTVVTSLSTVVFPSLFVASAREALAPQTLLFPRNLLLDSIGAGVLNFMQWDQWVGYAALWMWVLKITQEGGMRVQTKAGLLWRALEVVVCVALLGPGGAAVLFVWRRDETVE
ncbi:hypothetical protein N7508_006093 [Penicillium antarcticum]|uniref:uncharacterized protein n=1 Tax=Penicillium antarcticum TaxID=416450 RepID=UPI00238B2362|nr:uncharacterized protein N7508_006093 [Penicillium antarcticum]KAJ5307078.1 hypothetical protein N7508_006093 [Penicillium antarcticum]